MPEPHPVVWMEEDGILRVRCPPNCHVTLEVMEHVHRRHLEITRDPCAVLVFAESVASADYEAQQFPSREEVAATISAMGLIVRSAFTRAIAELFMRFHRPPYPTRIFRDEVSALEWLGRHRGGAPASAESGGLP